MKLTRDRRKAVWGMFGGRCAYCGIALVSTKWHVDHVEPVIYDLTYVKGGYADGQYTPSRMVKKGKMLHPERDVIENLFPACPACNINKGSETLEDWRGVLEGLVPNNLRKYNANSGTQSDLVELSKCLGLLFSGLENGTQHIK